jgi:lipopolysaccharide transport system ATP-binding protein
MARTIIDIQNISKKFQLGMVANGSLRETISNSFNWMLKKKPKDLNSDFWALKDINFKVNKGEIIGIIGRNGAGKSTLLKVLSRISEPTTGRIEINGRITSLLEVGTGFHPELSGRENVFLNGSILGMNKYEINQKFDEIVDFSGVEKFIDTPVKRYSSGMYVRLAFAVAAHLEAEVIVIDEVLAVGDSGFQQKCLGKMNNLAKSGRTILFVSHNMGTIQNLCTHGIVLDQGRVVCPKSEVGTSINYYLSQLRKISENDISQRKDRQGEGLIRATEIKIIDSETKSEINKVLSGQNIEFRIFFETEDVNNLHDINAALSIARADGFLITVLSKNLTGETFKKIDYKKGYFSCKLNKLPLMEGEYSINIAIKRKEVIQDWVRDAYIMSVENGDFYGTGQMIPNSHRGVLFEQDWSIYYQE